MLANRHLEKMKRRTGSVLHCGSGIAGDSAFPSIGSEPVFL